MSTSKKQMMDSDLISKIPDELLIDILSRLSIKEAAKTSVLSHRWENLWKFYTGCLDFDDDMETKVLGQKRFDMEQKKYIDWVNQVVISHRGSAIEQFRVSFDLGKDHTSTIDRWIAFAAARMVQRLELDLSSTIVCNKLWKPNKNLKEIYNFPSPWWWLGHDLKSLTSLRLEFVNVTDKHVSYFLSDCPLLEELSIAGAPSLRNLRVVGGAGFAGRQSLKLKHLEIRKCLWLDHLEVSAARNLVSFNYEGKSKYQGISMAMTNMSFQDVPQLSSVSLGRGDYCEHLVATSFRKLPFPISQLRMLTLDLSQMVSSKQYMFPCEQYEEFAQLTNLRQLELAFMVLDEQLSMLFVGSFLRASPRLHKLVLKYQVDWYQIGLIKTRPYFWEKVVEFGERHRQLVQGCKYECLKEVKFVGWSGKESEVEFVKHLIQAAGSLERITIDPRNPSRVGVDMGISVGMGILKRLPPSPDVIAAKEDARNRARDLEAKLSPTTKLLVL